MDHVVRSPHQRGWDEGSLLAVAQPGRPAEASAYGPDGGPTRGKRGGQGEKRGAGDKEAGSRVLQPHLVHRPSPSLPVCPLPLRIVLASDWAAAPRPPARHPLFPCASRQHSKQRERGGRIAISARVVHVGRRWWDERWSEVVLSLVVYLPAPPLQPRPYAVPGPEGGGNGTGLSEPA